MLIDHVAILTKDIEALKEYYMKYFGGIAGERYVNPSTGLNSYFLSFGNESRIEIMQKPGISEHRDNNDGHSYQGFTHLAFHAASIGEVIAKSGELKEAGFHIINGPRETGDGYFEFETFDPDYNTIEVTTKLPK